MLQRSHVCNFWRQIVNGRNLEHNILSSRTDIKRSSFNACERWSEGTGSTHSKSASLGSIKHNFFVLTVKGTLYSFTQKLSNSSSLQLYALATLDERIFRSKLNAKEMKYRKTTNCVSGWFSMAGGGWYQEKWLPNGACCRNTFRKRCQYTISYCKSCEKYLWMACC